MGANQSSRIYNVPIDEKKDGYSQIMRHPKYIDKLEYKPIPEIDNVQDLVLHGYSNSKEMNFFGKKNPVSNEFEYMTYDQVIEQAKQLGSAVKNLQFLKESSEQSNQKMELIGIYSKNRIEWGIADIANSLYGYTMVPLYDSLGPDSISYVLANSEITTCYCSAASVLTLSKTKDLHHLKNIISFDHVSEDLIELVKQRGIVVHLFKDIVEKGSLNVLPLPKLTRDTIFTFCYTSGTTGNPKSAMISHKNILASVTNYDKSDCFLTQDDVHLSYLPLPHIYERFINVYCWFKGTKIAFYSGDVHKIQEDIIASKPTCFSAVPRLLNRFYDAINSKLNQATGFQKILIQHALQTKLENIQKNGVYTHILYDKIIFNKIREQFGGRIRQLVCGSAPTSPKVFDFFKAVLSCSVIEGFGQTELSGVVTIQVKADPKMGNVGGIGPSSELKLEDVPEMEYLSTDKDELGNPKPRGEICVRGYNVFSGYYKDEEKTKEAIDQEGWFHTGDIGEIIPNGGLKIIDRKKNLFKLSQAEYVSPEKVENIYVRARGVQEVYIHGESLYNYCIGIIVPSQEELLKIAAELNISETDIASLCKNQQIISWYIKTIHNLGKHEGLFSFEQPKKIYLEPKSFLVIGCVTNSFKLQRHHAKNYFKNIIQELYNNNNNQ
ncbi:AMP-binding enzyme family protein (macronuclear) [Tetrahymena thermophila SB210]|uniref:AMP-binding enzyme family protein n=1 Tax=Tetrahymena thermophila (strain SB210) TaxID=312017 RepID=I7MB41_TETTS|nr:AMP-binding enzyme family protein [Tetrahymena thermophila SB210]EAS07571.1 AMP-binding enzyme family protein [Tetrahymena thermophila SB210]|eukprot:XP_001027813.1 AMP-binding enzyme family protein [Tetrahymena thermophila SB210]